MYFWKQDPSSPDLEPPEFTVDATGEFKQYLEKLNTSSEALNEQALEFLVLSWLTDLAKSGDARARQDTSMRWLVESGLIASLKKARIEMNPA